MKVVFQHKRGTYLRVTEGDPDGGLYVGDINDATVFEIVINTTGGSTARPLSLLPFCPFAERDFADGSLSCYRPVAVRVGEHAAEE